MSVLNKKMNVKVRLILFQTTINSCLKTVRDKMEQEIMDDFLTFKEPYFESVGNDFLKSVKRSYGQNILEALNGTFAYYAKDSINLKL